MKYTVSVSKRKNLGIAVMALLLLYIPLQSYAHFTSIRSVSSNVFGSGNHLCFYYNLQGGSAVQPGNPSIQTTTGQNRTISIDLGSLSSSSTITGVFLITNKASASNFALRIVGTSAPAGGTLDGVLQVSNMSLTPINKGQTYSIDATVTVRGNTKRGIYTGFIEVSDATNTSLTFSIPIRLSIL